MKLTLEQQQVLSVLHSQYLACWCSGYFRSQSISRHRIDAQSRNIQSPASEELSTKVIWKPEFHFISPLDWAETNNSPIIVPLLLFVSLAAFSRAGTEIVSRAARDRVAHYLQSLKQHFAGKYSYLHISRVSAKRALSAMRKHGG